MSIEIIYKLIESGSDKEALELIDQAKRKGESDPILTLYEALAIYDSGNDLRCLELLQKFIASSEDHEKYHYALFTSGICLMNLGLPLEAKVLFQSVPDSYPDIERERNEAESKIKEISKARTLFAGIVGQDNA